MDLIEDGTVLVFPTEESARAFSSLYVLERGRGLLASSCLAFDSFASLFMPGLDGHVQASDAARSVFASYASSVLSGRLQYFASSEYPEMRGRLAAFFRTILPGLDEAVAIPKKSRRASEDLLLLRNEYGRFLEAMRLYESPFMEFTVPDRLDRHYAVIMPDAFPKEERLMRALAGHPDVVRVDDLSSEVPAMTVYPNEKSEIRSLFLAIRKLTDSGVTMDCIALSVAPFERLRPYLEEEAYLFGIPLDFREGIPLLSTAPGAFLSDLAAIYSSSYSLDSLKSFMLNPSIPFREPEVLRRFIADSVRFSITSAPDRRNDRYMRLPKDSGQEYYRLLRLTLDKLMTETDPGCVEGELHTIMSGMLADEEFHGNTEDEAVYSFSMKALSDFLSAVSEADESGFSSGEPVFPAFISYLGNLRYVPRERVRGVSVYPFTQDAAIPFSYRFIIGLNEKEGAETVRKAAFLSDFEIAAERSDEEITGILLSLYAAMSRRLFLSASYETYAGFSLPLTSMLTTAVKGQVPAGDPVALERTGNSSAILPLQRCGYEHALSGALRIRKRDDDMTFSLRGPGKELPVTLSYTSYNAYARCPYLYALQYEFGLRNLPAFEPQDMDHLEIGSRLHSILERYYREGCSSPSRDVPRLFEEEMALWSDGRRFGDDGLVADMPGSASRPTAFLISYLRRRYLGRLEAVVREMDSVSVPLPGGLGIEEPLCCSFPEKGFSLEGRADRIALSKDGASYIVYDYKKGRRFQSALRAEKSWQFHVYRLLIGSDGRFSHPVSGAFFISLLDGCFSEASASPPAEELEASLGGAAAGIAGGDWHAESSDDNCKGCSCRGICRRRFSVR